MNEIQIKVSKNTPTGQSEILAPGDLDPPNTANVIVNYPSLGMDFVYDADGRYTFNGTAYNDLSSFLTATGGSFTRASIGTYFDSSGNLQTATANTPRFDYDPVTHTVKRILIEESRTNLGFYSTSPASWINNSATTTSTGITELGIFSSARIASTGGSWHLIS